MALRIYVPILIEFTAKYFSLEDVTLSNTSAWDDREYGEIQNIEANPNKTIKITKFSSSSSINQKIPEQTDSKNKITETRMPA